VSWFDYKWQAEQFRDDPPFYGVVMLAMHRADSLNAVYLRSAFPEVWDELQARYNAPGGLLDSDPPHLRERVLSGELS